MVAKTTYGSTFKGALIYGEGQDRKGKQTPSKSELLHTENLASLDARGMAEEMKSISKNHRVKVPVMHTSLSWKPGERITNDQMIKASLLYCQKMGANPDNHQIAVFRHHDKDHPHCHIYINRVPLDRSNAVPQSNDYIRNTKACKEITKELGFEKIEFIKNKILNDKNPEISMLKFEINKAITDALKKEKVKSIDELIQILNKQNIQTKLMENKNGISGISFKKNDYAFKGQDVNYKAAEIKKQIELTIEYNKKRDIGLSI